MPTLTEPVWESAQVMEPIPSSICSTNVRPSYMTGILLNMLRNHFSLATNITNDKLREALWQPKSDQENEQSHILVEPWHKYAPTHIQQRPGIYIVRGPVQIQDIAINDKALSHMSKDSGNYEGEEYLKLIVAQHQVLCCASKSDMASERLAEEVFYFLMEYAPAIRRDLSLGSFNVKQIAATRLIDEDEENFLTSVQITWMTAHSWQLKPLSPILKNIGLNPITT